MKFYVTEEEKWLIDEKMKQLPIKQYGACLLYTSPLHPHLNSQVHILFSISVPTYSTLLLCKPANVLTSFSKELTRFYRCCINQSFLSA